MQCICGNARGKIIFEGNDYSLTKCESCSLVRTNPVPLLQLQDEHDGAGIRHRKDRIPLWESFARRDFYILDAYISRDLRSKKLLEIGCSMGIFLKVFEESASDGWQCIGLDTDQEAVAFARERWNLNVLTKRLEDAGFSEEEFDIVVISHTLEHIYNLYDFLKEAKRILKKGGVLFISVPNFRSLPARLLKNRWYGLNPKQHVWQFTPKTLSRIIRGLGLSVEKIVTNKAMYYEKAEHGVAGFLFRSFLKLSELSGLADNLYLVARKMHAK